MVHHYITMEDAKKENRPFCPKNHCYLMTILNPMQGA